jgi:hypothetical protein
MKAPVLNKFREYYQQFDHKSFEDLAEIYAPNVRFSDPVHEVHGLSELADYFSQVCNGLDSCHFEFLGETVGSESAWFKWCMRYQHPKLRSGKELQLVGASYLHFSPDTQLIDSHEDFYDMGSMLYEHVPLLGGGVRWLKQRMAQEAQASI